MLPLFLRHSERKVLETNEPFISKSLTKIRNVCQLVILEFCLSSSVVYSLLQLMQRPGIFTKKKLFYPRVMYTFLFINMPNVTAGYGKFAEL